MFKTENLSQGFSRKSLRALFLRCVLLCIITLFCASAVSNAKTRSPVLVSETDSTRAIALESVTLTPEPFSPTAQPVALGSDERTRVMLFVLNLPAQAGADLSAFSADAEDAEHKHYSLKVEYVGQVPSQEWLSMVVLRLSDDLGDVGDVLVKLSYGADASNRVRMSIGHKGGGPPDDSGAAPTPAPPYTIKGRVTQNGVGMSGVSVTLSGTESGQATTDDTGSYSFTVMEVGDYTITPSKNFYEFTPRSLAFNNLTNHQTGAGFNAARQLFTVSGQVLDDGSNGLDGITVSLTDVTSGTTTTVNSSGGGNFSFSNVKAGFNYSIEPAQTNFYNFTSQQIVNLSSNSSLKFAGALREYNITGRVTDANGVGVICVRVSLGGAQTSDIVTDLNGNYSFKVLAAKNYTITPSILQNYYTFAPASQTLNSLGSDQSVSFTATLVPLTNPTSVLEFDGTPKSVDYRVFWPGGVDLGHFFWEFWARPGSNAGATYMISDGYGGAHALLFGVANYGSSEPGRYQLLGDIFDGVLDITHVYYFGGDQGPAIGEWAHMAVGWDGQNVITYYNGVPVGRTSFKGPRQSPGVGQGGSWLLIGGSDHSNFDGRIAEVRGYEGSNPREDAADVRAPESSFIPQTVFSVDGNFLSWYFRPSTVVADLSRGYNGSAHPGFVRSTLNGILYPCDGCPLPQYVNDPTAPNFVTNAPPQPVTISSPAPVPNGALVFDSFERLNSTYMFNSSGGLGSTEGGAAGQRAWQTYPVLSGRKPFGILNGMAVLLANTTSIAWVDTGSSTGNLNISAERHARFWNSGVSTGLSFRVTDEKNYFFAYTTGDATGNQTLTVGYYLDGHRTDLVTNVAMPASWTTLRVVTKNTGSINVYADGMLLYSTTSSVLASAAGAGLYNNAPGLALVNRWDNFTASEAP